MYPMEKTVTFLPSGLPPSRGPDRRLVCSFDFSVVDSSLIGTPRERGTIHYLTITMTLGLLRKWELEPPRGGVSNEMLKVAFQKALEYITAQLKSGSLTEGELVLLSLDTSNSEDSCPYQLSNVDCPPHKTKFQIPLEQREPSSVLGAIQNVDRQYMQLAITEAKKTKAEDERTHPKVGAVVVKEDQVLASSHRGEMGSGNHAEFGALEKKLGQEVVSGATLYTTLEPCTSRQHPKVGCAQRLVERGVKRVVIGMLDPNPSIRGTGVGILRSAKIVTEFFDSDLMDIVEELKREFMRKYRNADGSPLASRLSISAAWLELNGRLVSLDPLYDEKGQLPEDSDFRVEEVTDCDIKFKKESNGQTVFLPVACLSVPWRANSYGGMRATIEKGKLYFDAKAQTWRYQS